MTPYPRAPGPGRSVRCPRNRRGRRWSVLIGCLPTYQTVGVWTLVLLVAVRVVQGLAFGAEWGGAILMTFEHAPWRKRGLYTGITQAGFPVGLLLANLAFLLSSRTFDGTWAWRVPFLLSAVLIVVGILIRLKIDESPEFEELEESGQVSRNPLIEVLRDDWRNDCAPSACGSGSGYGVLSPTRRPRPVCRPAGTGRW
ncbi:MFS transporter [Streptomyces scopuliridis]|uniref:MFS transporter n=1 Tax=Streptomyces scopuliridis TaxID=452529 RepID=A0ACD4ZLW6_9ACTN|nr:MFS transporter [Streptomyces scopuliridis]WSB99011.1 MFS transporter [Streptomyces scopuliridis]WSC07287.1 MFS transporter [Streptomyces scopuliridis]